jgi:hypothetical protein
MITQNLCKILRLPKVFRHISKFLIKNAKIHIHKFSKIPTIFSVYFKDFEFNLSSFSEASYFDYKKIALLFIKIAEFLLVPL